MTLIENKDKTVQLQDTSGPNPFDVEAAWILITKEEMRILSSVLATHKIVNAMPIPTTLLKKLQEAAGLLEIPF